MHGLYPGALEWLPLESKRLIVLHRECRRFLRWMASSGLKIELEISCYLELEVEIRMTKIKLNRIIEKARKSLDEEDASPAFKEAVSDLFVFVSFLTRRLGLNS